MATPYELRFDMYNAALDRQSNSYWATKEALDQARERNELVDASTYPKFPTTEEAIKEAKVIMAFVNGDKTTE
jgi:hypothetical protein